MYQGINPEKLCSDPSCYEVLFSSLKKEKLNRDGFLIVEQLKQSLLTTFPVSIAHTEPHSHITTSPNRVVFDFFHDFACPPSSILLLI